MRENAHDSRAAAGATLIRDDSLFTTDCTLILMSRTDTTNLPPNFTESKVLVRFLRYASVRTHISICELNCHSASVGTATTEASAAQPDEHLRLEVSLVSETLTCLERRSVVRRGYHGAEFVEQ